MDARLDLVGVSEIAEMLGVTRQRVDRISRTDPDFPQPVAEIHAGRIWLRDDIRAWASRSGRTISSGPSEHEQNGDA